MNLVITIICNIVYTVHSTQNVYVPAEASTKLYIVKNYFIEKVTT